MGRSIPFLSVVNIILKTPVGLTAKNAKTVACGEVSFHLAGEGPCLLKFLFLFVFPVFSAVELLILG